MRLGLVNSSRATQNHAKPSIVGDKLRIYRNKQDLCLFMLGFKAFWIDLSEKKILSHSGGRVLTIPINEHKLMLSEVSLESN